MQFKAILFDLDGTLLPMDMDTFTKGYFASLKQFSVGDKVSTKEFIDAMWHGVAAMQRNDGEETNEAVFWEVFKKYLSVVDDNMRATTNLYYATAFDENKKFTIENPLAKEAVRIAHEKAEKVILATNPLFPMAAQRTRLSWLGLSPEDFDLVTSYETCYYCKPQPLYFTKDVLAPMSLQPSDCLMIGNDEEEDMYAASLAGFNCYLVTDCCLPSEKHPWHGARGSFSDMLAMLYSLD